MREPSANRLPPILPIGTAVVALVELRGADGRPVHMRGATGVIVTAPVDPDHSYRVRLDGGDDFSLRRRELQVLSHYTSDGYAAHVDPLAEHDLTAHVIYRCVIGSRAYGLEHDDSDVDRRGIYLPPASMHWSVYGVPEQLERPESEECYWEFEKFIKLALKANPNVLEVLHSPIVEHVDPLAEPLLAARSIFLSRLIYQTFNGYAMSQFRKIEAGARTKGAIKWKHAMHLIRLLRAGVTALRTGELPVLVTDGADELRSIRDGLFPWDRVEALRRGLSIEFEAAFAESRLPDRPDYDRANAILVEARARMARREGLA